MIAEVSGGFWDRRTDRHAGRGDRIRRIIVAGDDLVNVTSQKIAGSA